MWLKEGSNPLFFNKPAAAFKYSFLLLWIILLFNPFKKLFKMETAKTQGVLKSVANAIKSNSNGTMFRQCTVEINSKVYFAKIWEKSFQNGVTVGNTYTVELQNDGDTVWLTVLNGTSASIATKADFAEMFATL